MSEAKRPRGRPRVHPAGTTGADRKRLHRIGAGVVQVEVSSETAAALDTLSRRHADPSRAATVARLVREALGEVYGAIS